MEDFLGCVSVELLYVLSNTLSWQFLTILHFGKIVWRCTTAKLFCFHTICFDTICIKTYCIKTYQNICIKTYCIYVFIQSAYSPLRVWFMGGPSCFFSKNCINWIKFYKYKLNVKYLRFLMRLDWYVLCIVHIVS